MATETTKKHKPVHVANVIRHGDAINVPESISLRDASDILRLKADEEEQIVAVNETVPVFPWEGAIAFKKALEKVFGVAVSVSTPGFFGPNPPSEIAIDVGPGKRGTVLWGRFKFPNADADEYLQTHTDMVDGRVVFKILGQVRRKRQPTIRKVAEETLNFAISESIYRSHALKIEFTDSQGGTVPMPQPKFLDLSEVNIDEVIFNEDLTAILKANVFDHIVHRDELKSIGVPFKMGTLLDGKYGTGKSLFARAVAKVATDNGVTFIYLKKGEDMAQAIEFAAMYQPAVVFVEDIDRTISERTDKANEIVNLLDGIDSKGFDVMTIVTTNHLNKVAEVLLRPGRIDLAVHIELPNAETVQRLVLSYGRNRIAEGADLSGVGQLLEGRTPATIREAVERAKRFMVSRTQDANTLLTAEDLELAAKTVVQQQELIEAANRKPEPTSWADQLVSAVADKTHTTFKANGLGKIQKQVRELHEEAGLS